MLHLAGGRLVRNLRALRPRRHHARHHADLSHAAGAFAATGEPATRVSEPLAERNGPLAIAPQEDGPLRIRGNLEIVSGTARTVFRSTNAALCRCGGSANKPFCDGTHKTNGFRASGAKSSRKRSATGDVRR